MNKWHALLLVTLLVFDGGDGNTSHGRHYRPSAISSNGHGHHEGAMVSDNADYDDERFVGARTSTGSSGNNNNRVAPSATPVDSSSRCPDDEVLGEIDEIFIMNFLKTYKHINTATLLMCGDHSESTGARGHGGGARDGSGCRSRPDRTNTSVVEWGGAASRPSSVTNFLVRIAKRLMASSILIKALDIDEVILSANCGGGEVANASSTQRSGHSRTSSSSDTNAEAAFRRKLINMLKSCDFHQAVVLDLSCLRSDWVLQQVSHEGLFNASYHWLLLNPPKPSGATSIQSILGQLNINMNSEITVAKRRSFSKTNHGQPMYDLFDVWSPGVRFGGQVHIVLLAIYNSALMEFRWMDRTSLIVRRLDMQAVPLRCMMVLTIHITEPIEQFLQHADKPHLDSMNRFNFVLLTYVRDMFNFTFKMSRTNTWGYSHNGTFDGLVGALERKEVDIGGAPVFFREERFRVVDATARTWIARPCFIFRHPTGHIRNIFLQPFSEYVWWAILGCGILTIFVASHVCTVERRIDTEHLQSSLDRILQRHPAVTLPRKHQVGYNGPVLHSLANDGITSSLARSRAAAFVRKCVQYINIKETNFTRSTIQFVGAMCQQGSTESPRMPAGRCIVALLLLFSFAIYQFYSASIVGSLLMEKPKSIRTLRNLIDSGLRVGIEDILYTKDYFRRTTDPDAIELYLKKVQVVDKQTGNITLNYEKPPEGMRKMKAGGFAFHVDVATVYKTITDTFTEREVCELSEIQLFPPQAMQAVVQKRSPIRKMVTYGLRRVTEAGLLYRQRAHWHSPKPLCVRQIHPSDLQVGMQSTSSAYLILLVGFMLSTTILLVEIGLGMWHLRPPALPQKRIAKPDRRRLPIVRAVVGDRRRNDVPITRGAATGRRTHLTTASLMMAAKTSKTPAAAGAVASIVDDRRLRRQPPPPFLPYAN